MNREELIDQAGKVIWVAGLPERNRDWGERVWGAPNMRDDPARIRALAQADAALAVFEQAHTPTDDEQFAKSFGGWTPDEVARNPRAAAEVIERLRSRVIDGFRRTEQSEPSDAQVLAALNAHYRVRLAQFEAMPGDPEVQGDAHSLEEYSSKSIDRMRAALRAATQEGEPR